MCHSIYISHPILLQLLITKGGRVFCPASDRKIQNHLEMQIELIMNQIKKYHFFVRLHKQYLWYRHAHVCALCIVEYFYFFYPGALKRKTALVISDTGISTPSYEAFKPTVTLDLSSPSKGQCSFALLLFRGASSC